MENGTLIQVFIEQDLNHALDNHLMKVRHIGIKTSKADLIVKLMRIGLRNETRELFNEERAEK